MVAYAPPYNTGSSYPGSELCIWGQTSGSVDVNVLGNLGVAVAPAPTPGNDVTVTIPGIVGVQQVSQQASSCFDSYL